MRHPALQVFLQELGYDQVFLAEMTLDAGVWTIQLGRPDRIATITIADETLAVESFTIDTPPVPSISRTE